MCCLHQPVTFAECKMAMHAHENMQHATCNMHHACIMQCTCRVIWCFFFQRCRPSGTSNKSDWAHHRMEITPIGSPTGLVVVEKNDYFLIRPGLQLVHYRIQWSTIVHFRPRQSESSTWLKKHSINYGVRRAGFERDPLLKFREILLRVICY